MTFVRSPDCLVSELYTWLQWANLEPGQSVLGGAAPEARMAAARGGLTGRTARERESNQDRKFPREFLGHIYILGGCEPLDTRSGRQVNRHPPDERLFGARLTPGTGIGKPEPRRERPNVPEAGSIGTLRAGNSNLVLAKTHLSLGFRWNSCRRPVHAGAGSGGGRSSAISRRISANSLLVTATSAIWKAT